MYLRIRILDEEKEALRRLADVERRPMRQQAALMVRRELERRGLLPAQPVTGSETAVPQVVRNDGQ
jgi:hypothetical protein